MIARDDWAIKVWIDIDCCSLLPAFFEAADDDAVFAMPSPYNGVWYVISLAESEEHCRWMQKVRMRELRSCCVVMCAERGEFPPKLRRV